MTVAAVVLAAGGGTRFRGAGHKLRAPFQGRPVVSWVLDAVDEAGYDHVYVVTGAVELNDLVAPHHTIITNLRWAEGQSTSLVVAIERAEADGHDAIVVGLGDQPLVPAAAWRSVGAAAGAIVVATFNGARRPPVKLTRPIWPDLPRSGDFGARALIEQRPELVSEIPCGGNPVDIDTVEDLQRWS